MEALPPAQRIGADVLCQGHKIINWAAWKRLDEIETAGAVAGRCRSKIATRADMLKFSGPDHFQMIAMEDIR